MPYFTKIHEEMRAKKQGGGGLTSRYSLDQIERAMIAAEATGEGLEGMIAVKNIIDNREASGMYGPKEKDFFAPKQWQPARDGRLQEFLDNPNHPAMKQAAEVQEMARKGTLPNLVGNATQFMATSEKVPSFAAGNTKQLGNHIFYKGKNIPDDFAGAYQNTSAPQSRQPMALSDQVPMPPQRPSDIPAKVAPFRPASDLSLTGYMAAGLPTPELAQKDFPSIAGSDLATDPRVAKRDFPRGVGANLKEMGILPDAPRERAPARISPPSSGSAPYPEGRTPSPVAASINPSVEQALARLRDIDMRGNQLPVESGQRPLATMDPRSFDPRQTDYFTKGLPDNIAATAPRPVPGQFAPLESPQAPERPLSREELLTNEPKRYSNSINDQFNAGVLPKNKGPGQQEMPSNFKRIPAFEVAALKTAMPLGMPEAPIRDMNLSQTMVQSAWDKPPMRAPVLGSSAFAPEPVMGNQATLASDMRGRTFPVNTKQRETVTAKMPYAGTERPPSLTPSSGSGVVGLAQDVLARRPDAAPLSPYPEKTPAPAAAAPQSVSMPPQRPNIPAAKVMTPLPVQRPADIAAKAMAANEQAKALRAQTPQPGMEYEVRKGDTLWDIAKAADVPFAEIKRPDVLANRRLTNPDRIFPGDVVKVPLGMEPTSGPLSPEMRSAMQRQSQPPRALSGIGSPGASPLVAQALIAAGPPAAGGTRSPSGDAPIGMGGGATRGITPSSGGTGNASGAPLGSSGRGDAGSGINNAPSGGGAPSVRSGSAGVGSSSSTPTRSSSPPAGGGSTPSQGNISRPSSSTGARDSHAARLGHSKGGKSKKGGNGKYNRISRGR